MSSYFKISKANSIRYADRTVSTKKNDYNSLSWESLSEYKYVEVQNFIKSDIIATQFRSNYLTITATLTDENGNDTSLPITKKTTNIGRQKRYDGKYYNYKGEGVYTGIYFDTGNEYTYNSSSVIQPHELIGSLPEFAIIGQEVEIIGLSITEPIVRIVYDEDIDSNVMLIANAYSGVETESQIQSEYDIQDFEVYEFPTDFAAISNICYITISNTEVNKATVIFRSESLNIQTAHEGTIEVAYYNNLNDGIYYSTGIQHKLRLGFNKVVSISDNENEVNITDSTVGLIESNIEEKNTFFFNELTSEMMRKLKIALSSKIVIINDEGYISNSIKEENINNTNLYTVEATMFKTGFIYYEYISAVGFNYTLSTTI